MKPSNIPYIHNLFIEFDKSLCFENEVLQFLDIKIFPLGPTIYRKNIRSNTFILKLILLGIRKSAGFEVLLHQPNRYLVPAENHNIKKFAS